MGLEGFDDALGSAGGAGHNQLLLAGTSPGIYLRSAGFQSLENGGGTVGAWFRYDIGVANTVADYMRIGSTPVTGVAMGNTSANGFTLFNQAGGGSAAAVSIAECVLANGIPNAGERSSMDAYGVTRYAGSVGFG